MSGLVACTESSGFETGVGHPRATLATEDLRVEVGVTSWVNIYTLEMGLAASMSFWDGRASDLVGVELAEDDEAMLTFRGQTTRMGDSDPGEHPTQGPSDVETLPNVVLAEPIHQGEVMTIDLHRGSFTSATITVTLPSGFVVDPIADVSSTGDLTVSWTPADDHEVDWQVEGCVPTSMGVVPTPATGTFSIAAAGLGRNPGVACTNVLTLDRKATVDVPAPFAAGHVAMESGSIAPFVLTP